MKNIKLHNLRHSLVRTLFVVATILSINICASADSYYDRRVSLFDTLPIGPNDIVFLGNSITDGGEFQELLGMSNVKNRGISSDVISGVEKRLKQVLKGHPKKVFLLIGINDVSHDLTVSQLASKYEQLVKKMRSMSPGTKLYLQSVMPVNNDFKRYKLLVGKEKVIKEFNAKIKQIAARNSAVYINLTSALSDSSGKLKKEYTNDGLHLTGAGYKAWMSVVKPYIAE
jgi:lysophospholipase L1-like esterase